MSKGTVLVVEDDIVIGNLIENRLRKLGYAVCGIVNSGEEAIIRATEQKPDLVLMDIQLAGDIDGIAASRIIHNQQSIPIIYLTSFADDYTLDRAKRTDPAGYIMKPFSDDDLRTAIEIALFKYSRDAEPPSFAASN
jgi:CheY-like chemotaxis protein